MGVAGIGDPKESITTASSVSSHFTPRAERQLRAVTIETAAGKVLGLSMFKCHAITILLLGSDVHHKFKTLVRALHG
jgi:hypothetical protein